MYQDYDPQEKDIASDKPINDFDFVGNVKRLE
jgi:hypothetical protein